MSVRNLVVAIIWLAFTAFSLVVIADHGYTGFITLALREPWGMQMLIDLGIALGLFGGFVIKDARARGLTPWPWLVAMLFLGSIGALPYLLWRQVRGRVPDVVAAR